MVFEKLEDVEVKTGKLLVNRVTITVRVCVGGWVGGGGVGVCGGGCLAEIGKETNLRRGDTKRKGSTTWRISARLPKQILLKRTW